MITIQKVCGTSKSGLRWSSVFLVLAILTGCSLSSDWIMTQERWVVYYDNEIKSEAFTPYDLVVFDNLRHPDLTPLVSHDRTLLAYLSLGEVKTDTPLHQKTDPAILIRKHDFWSSELVDIRDSSWKEAILKSEIPKIKAKGFNGLMLDTIDTPLMLEREDPIRFAGMKDAAIDLIRSIRRENPDLKIMLNRGFEIFPEIADDVDMILAESVLSNYDLPTSKGVLYSAEAYQQYLAKLNQIRLLNLSIKVYSLDYWDMNDVKGVQYLYKTQRKHGFVPYVTTPDLTEIHHESKASFTAPSVEETSSYA